MKVRNGFVTNSSSSSFLVMRIKSDKLSEIIDIHKLYDGYNRIEHMISIEEDGSISYREDDSGWYECPSSLLDAINFLIMVLTNDEDLYIHEEESENLAIKIEDYEKEDSDLVTRIAASIFRNRKEILGDTELIEVTCTDCGYGGDDDTRYNKDSYSEETLQSIYETIAEENNKSVEEVTDDDFDDYVGDKTSVSEETFRYTRVNGVENIESESSYYLE